MQCFGSIPDAFSDSTLSRFWPATVRTAESSLFALSPVCRPWPGSKHKTTSPVHKKKVSFSKKTFTCENVSLWMVFVDGIERVRGGRFSFSVLVSSKKKNSNLRCFEGSRAGSRGV